MVNLGLEAKKGFDKKYKDELDYNSCAFRD